MIFNLPVAVVSAIALFALVVGSYTATKAYKVGEKEKTATGEQRYELEKDFYLVSTVGWMTFVSRIVAIPLFFIAVISLIPSVPGAMCEFGVFQAGSPWSWVDLGLKLVTLFAFGGWLFIDYANRKQKGSPFMGILSRGFVLLTPLLYVDAFLDIVFFGSLNPLVVPCCMVVYPPTAFFSCPFCLITFQMPLLMGAIPAYAISLALMIWSFLLKSCSRKLDIQLGNPIISKALVTSIILAIVGTLLLVTQILLGPLGARPIEGEYLSLGIN